jgi:hypothetical protein
LKEVGYRAKTVMTTKACEARRWSEIRLGNPAEVKIVRYRLVGFDIASAACGSSFVVLVA